MAPRSPTHAFEPTPALDHDRNNFSPLSQESSMLSFDSHASRFPREVHFADPPNGTVHRAHSIATDNVPLLPPIPSASTIPRTAFRITNPTPGIDITAYIENCRNLNEQLRQAHEAERRAWNIERAALRSRIADLEFKLNKSTDNKRRSSNDSQSSLVYHNSRTDFRAIYQSKTAGGQKPVTDSIVPKVAPVWKGPESVHPTTRVFHTEETNGHLPSISEDGPLQPLSKEISPHSAVIENEPVPIEKVDSTLDGITLRSAALTSSFEAKITSPQFGSPSLSPEAQSNDIRADRNTLHIDASALLSPLDEKLKRHAGHTPMALHSDNVSMDVSNQTTELPTPVAEHPPAPAPSTRPPLRPSEHSDSYFSVVSDTDSKVPETIAEEPVSAGDGDDLSENQEPQPHFEPEDDRPLTGPLMLDPSASTKAASVFLEALDAKLEAVKESSPERNNHSKVTNNTVENGFEASERGPTSGRKSEVDDDIPQLRLKKSTNFGSAYGFNMPGRM